MLVIVISAMNKGVGGIERLGKNDALGKSCQINNDTLKSKIPTFLRGNQFS